MVAKQQLESSCLQTQSHRQSSSRRFAEKNSLGRYQDHLLVEAWSSNSRGGVRQQAKGLHLCPALETDEQEAQEWIYCSFLEE